MRTTNVVSSIVMAFLLMSCVQQSRDSQQNSTKQTDVKQGGTSIKRYCLMLDLKDDPELIKEYKHWHDSKNIWPEIPNGIHEVGILDMEIYLLGTRLFMILEAPADFDFDKQMAKLADLPRQKEWESFVSRFQKSSPDARSSEKWKMMDKIFKLP